jgi:hypothetical protein
MITRFDLAGAILAFSALAAAPVVAGSSYITGVLTVALCYATGPTFSPILSTS